MANLNGQARHTCQLSQIVRSTGMKISVFHQLSCMGDDSNLKAIAMETVECDGGVAVTKWHDAPDVVIIPPMDGTGRLITRISKECFAGSAIRSVFVGANVKIIEKNSFRRCGSLSEVRFEDGSCLREIKARAF